MLFSTLVLNPSLAVRDELFSSDVPLGSRTESWRALFRTTTFRSEQSGTTVALYHRGVVAQPSKGMNASLQHFDHIQHRGTLSKTQE